MEVDNDKAALIKEDASLLLRPKTGLNDMVIEVDPGVAAESVEEGETIPLASTQPNVNPDEFLAALDADTQAFLKLLLAGRRRGARSRAGPRAQALRRAAPARAVRPRHRQDQRRAGAAPRAASAARSTTSGLLTEELGNRDEDLTAFVDSSNAVLRSLRQPGGGHPRGPAGAAAAP